MSRAEPHASAKVAARSVVGRIGPVVALCFASLLTICMTIAPAQERHDEKAIATSEFDSAALPPLDSIDAQTDIASFLRIGVPAPIHLAALRRAWTVDPAIRDFKGLEESDWNFDDPNSIPGFGDLDPETDVEMMVAEILGAPTRLAALSLTRSYEPTSSSSLVNSVRRLVFGTVHNLMTSADRLEGRDGGSGNDLQHDR